MAHNQASSKLRKENVRITGYAHKLEEEIRTLKAKLSDADDKIVTLREEKEQPTGRISVPEQEWKELQYIAGTTVELKKEKEKLVAENDSMKKHLIDLTKETASLIENMKSVQGRLMMTADYAMKLATPQNFGTEEEYRSFIGTMELNISDAQSCVRDMNARAACYSHTAQGSHHPPL